MNKQISFLGYSTLLRDRADCLLAACVLFALAMVYGLCVQWMLGEWLEIALPDRAFAKLPLLPCIVASFVFYRVLSYLLVITWLSVSVIAAGV